MLRFNNRFFALILLVLSLSACDGNEGPKETAPIDEIELEIEVKRFDQAMLATATAIAADSNYQAMALYEQYLKDHKDFVIEWLYSGNDSVATDSFIAYDLCYFLRQPAFLNLLDTINEVYPPEYDFSAQLTNPYKRLKHFFPEIPVKPFVTYVSGYSQSGTSGTDEIYLGEDYIGLGLHFFMGQHFPYYPPDVPQFIKRRFDPKYIPVHVFGSIAERMAPQLEPFSQPTLSDLMIREGVKLYLLDMVLPFEHDSVKIFYDTEQIMWAEYWEAKIYQLLLDNLYSKDFQVHEEYLGERPYTKGLALESAPRIAAYCGWQIVRSYMARNPDLTVKDLFEITDYSTIIQGANYRPEGPLE